MVDMETLDKEEDFLIDTLNKIQQGKITSDKEAENKCETACTIALNLIKDIRFFHRLSSQ